ncbi:unnamed protein product [Chrysoparadoxa australica]
MGGVTSAFKPPEPEFISTEKPKPIKGVDTRRRNSLMFFMMDWVKASQSSWPAQEANMFQVAKYWKMEDKDDPTKNDPILAKLQKGPKLVSLGDFRQFKVMIIQKWKEINKSYQGALMGDTLLHIVCREGYLAMLEMMTDPKTKSMLETEVLEVNCLNKRKRTPLMLCFTPPSFTYVAREWGIVEDQATGLAVPNAQRPAAAVTDHDWCKPGGGKERARMVAILIELGAEVDTKDMHSFTCLHYAVINGWIDTVELLLSKGAKVEQTCQSGETALHFAMELKHGAIAEMLLERQPNLVNEADDEGNRPIHLAARSGERAYIDLLVDYKADITSPNYKGVTPLKLVCQRNDYVLVNVLLDYKVPKEEEAFALLEGEAEEKIRWRLKQDAAQAKKLADSKSKHDNEAVRLKALAAYGKWVPYNDKLGKGIFYYNTVSRESQWEVPPDYVKDREYIMKTATFGMSFYH